MSVNKNPVNMLSVSYPSSSSSSSSSSSILPSSSPAIDRYNPIIRDSSRIAKTGIEPVGPIPKPHKGKKSINKKRIPFKENEDESKKIDDTTIDLIMDRMTMNDSKLKKKKEREPNPSDFTTISPSGSTRYLLNEKGLAPDHAFDFDHNSTSSNDCPDQVVVLRVSLHCRGCERKMRKHLSKMEGVKWFDIDFGAKKVTVSGKVTAMGVVASISKVKNAQLWPSSVSSFKNDQLQYQPSTPLSFYP